MAEVFPIAPASAKPLWLLAGVCLLLAGVLALLAYSAYSSRHSRVEVRGDGLRLVGDLWGRTVPLAALELERAAILDLTQAFDYTPARRTFGTGLPGYQAGWFRLRNGEKALAYVTRRDAVAYLPTSAGYSLLLSVERPRDLLAALRANAGR